MRVGSVLLLAMSIACVVWSPDGRGQDTSKPARIGRLSPLSAESDAPFLDAYRKGLSELGWIEGKHYAIESRFADGRIDRLPGLAISLVQQRVDLILVGSNAGALAAKGATTTIPIVMVTSADPVGAGAVASLARPGANITGVTTLSEGLIAKRLELLRHVLPGIGKVAVLTNPRSADSKRFIDESGLAARSLGLQMQVAQAQDVATLGAAFDSMNRERVAALTVLNDVLFIRHHRQIVELAAASRLPAVYGDRAFVDAGGLMFYGASLIDSYRQAARHTDRILKGTKPADLPFEQPTQFEFVINLKAARALGLTIPAAALARADKLIE